MVSGNSLENIISIYEKAIYRIEELNYNIKINDFNSILDKYLEDNKFDNWAIITAYNPMSELIPEEENIKANAELEEDIKHYQKLKSQGLDPLGKWPEEKGYIIFDIDEEKAKEIGKKYKQRAIVYSNKNEKARIIVLA